MSKKNTTHLAGEFLVAGELSRRGYPVSITMGNAKSVDIYAESSKEILKIDAKAGRAKGNWPINKNNVKKDIYYIFVHLQTEKKIKDNGRDTGRSCRTCFISAIFARTSRRTKGEGRPHWLESLSIRMAASFMVHLR